MTEERKAVERLACRMIVTVAAVVALWVFVPFLWDKLSPFVIAVPMAALMQPVITFLERRMKIKRGAAVLLPVVAVCLAACLMIYWFVSFGIGELMAVLNNSGAIIGDGVNVLRTVIEKLVSALDHLPAEAAAWLRSALNDAVTWLYEQCTLLAGRMVTLTVNMATGIPYALVYANFLIIGLYFIAKDYDNIRSYLPGGRRRDPNSSASQLTHSAISGLLGYLRVQTTYALLSLLVSWVYLELFGFRYTALIAMIAATLEFMPLFGNGTLYIPWAIIAFIIGDTAAGTQVLILDLALLMIRRITEPKLLSDRIGISPLLSLVGMFAGMRFGGILGMVGGPVIMVVLVGALRGPYFNHVKRDVRLIVTYLKKRWEPAAPEEPVRQTAADKRSRGKE